MKVEVSNASADLQFNFDPQIIMQWQKALGVSAEIISNQPMTISLQSFLGLGR